MEKKREMENVKIKVLNGQIGQGYYGFRINHLLNVAKKREMKIEIE